MKRIENINFIRIQYRNLNDLQLEVLRDWCLLNLTHPAIVGGNKAHYIINGCEAFFENEEDAANFEEYWLSEVK